MKPKVTMKKKPQTRPVFRATETRHGALWPTAISMETYSFRGVKEHFSISSPWIHPGLVNVRGIYFEDMERKQSYESIHTFKSCLVSMQYDSFTTMSHG